MDLCMSRARLVIYPKTGMGIGPDVGAASSRGLIGTGKPRLSIR